MIIARVKTDQGINREGGREGGSEGRMDGGRGGGKEGGRSDPQLQNNICDGRAPQEGF